MAKTNKTNKTNTNKNNKNNKVVAPKTAQAVKAENAPKVKSMTYPQAIALTNAIVHSNKTKADLSAMIDALIATLPEESKPQGRSMSEDKKKAWLEKSGKEPCTYGQAKMFAFTLLKAKASYEQVSEMIDGYDKASGYVRKPKEEKKPEEKKAE